MVDMAKNDNNSRGSSYDGCTQLLFQMASKCRDIRRCRGIDDRNSPDSDSAGGNGFSKIKRQPAYTFGSLTPVSSNKPAATAYARAYNTQGIGRKGPFKITHSVVSTQIDPPGDKLRMPGPDAYAPRTETQCKRPPAYTMRPAAQPPYQSWDQWTPPPNMYCPNIPWRKPPMYSLGYTARSVKVQEIPGPGEHEPNFNYIKKKKPAYTFGLPYQPIKLSRTPPPNTYCEKKFMVSKRTTPSPSFGIRHTPYLGQHDVPLLPSKLQVMS